MKNKIKLIILGIIVLLFLIWSFYDKGYTDVNFYIENTGEDLNGDIYIDNVFFGKVEQGNYHFDNYSFAGSEIEFRVNRSGKTYSYYYDIPWDIEDYSEMDYVIYSNQFTEEYEYVPDEFSFNEEAHWTHMPITYKIDSYCGDYEERQLDRAFQHIQNKTYGSVSFKKIENNSADILIGCEFIEDCYEYHLETEDIDEYFYWRTEWETICAHDLGYAQITDYRGNKILKANITRVGLAGFAETKNRGVSGFKVGNCGHLNTELHEILHTFGYDHTNYGIMAPYQEYTSGYQVQTSGECQNSEQEIDDWIIEDLINTYSKPNYYSIY